MSRRKKNEVVVDDDFEEDDSSERLSVWDAADIWASNGKDEDYMFGYRKAGGSVGKGSGAKGRRESACIGTGNTAGERFLQL